jgi:hypothetical protein
MCRMNRALLILHTVSVVIAYATFALSWLYLSRTTHFRESDIVLQSVVLSLSIMGFVTGLALLFQRRGRSESVTLAASTVAAFLLAAISF